MLRSRFGSPRRTALLSAATTAFLLALPAAQAGAASPLQPQNEITGIASAAKIGDVNHDGIADFGVQLQDHGASVSGAIVFGSRTRTNLDLTDPSTLGKRGILITKAVDSVSINSVVGLGDIDGDGNIDVGINTDGHPYILFGSATAPAAVDLASSPNLASVTATSGNLSRAGDVDGDGTADLAISWVQGPYAKPGTKAGVTIVRGGPRLGTIVPWTSDARQTPILTNPSCQFIWVLLNYVCLTAPPTVVPIGDFTGDGKADLYVDTGKTGNQYLFYGGPLTGQFSADTPPAGRFTRFAPTSQLQGKRVQPAGDVNGDGRADIVMPRQGSGLLDRAIFLGRANPPASIPVASTDVISLKTKQSIFAGAAVGDQNGDGKADLAYWVAPDNSGNGPIIVTGALPAPGGTSDLDALTPVPVQGGPVTDLGDIDGDGYDEVLVNSHTILGHGPDASAPHITTVYAAPPQFAPAATATGTATTIEIGIDEAATVTISYAKRGGGAVLGTDTRALRGGTSQIAFSGWVGGQPLPIGDYEVRVTARDAAGNVSAPSSWPISVVGGGQTPNTYLVISSTVSDPSGVDPGVTAVDYTGTCLGGQAASFRDQVDPTTPNGATFDLLPGMAVGGGTCTLFATPVGVDAAKCTWTTKLLRNGTDAFGPPFDGTYHAVGGTDYLEITEICTPKPGTGGGSGGGTTGTIPALGAGWKASGSATLGTGSAALTPAAAGKVGSAFWPTAVDPNGKTFEFTAQLTGGNGGGNGLALAFVKSDGSGPTGGYLGTGGGALGLGGLTFAALALDTNQDPGDPSGSFLGLADGTKGTSLNYLQSADAGIRIRNTTPITYKLVSKGGVVSVYVNGGLRMTRTMTLPSPAFVGFTASTGASVFQAHTVSAVKVTAS